MSNEAALIEKAKAEGVFVLTNKGGKYEVADKYRDLLCLTSDHVLHVAKGERLNAEVRTLVDRLGRDKIFIGEERIHETSITFLQQLYKHLTPDTSATRAALVLEGHEGPSDMQRDVMRIIRDAVDKGASDIHFVLKPTVLDISYRIHGEMFHVNERSSRLGHLLLATR